MRIVLPLLPLLLVLLGGRASADDWTDARNQFRTYQRNERWQERAAGYQTLLDYDSAKALDELLSAALKEKNARVLLAAIKVLGEFQTKDAQDAFLKALARPASSQGELLLMALAEMKGDFGVERLIQILRGKDALPAALAANALGAKAVEAGLVPLIEMLGHKEWQVAAAAARGIKAMAWSEWTVPDKKKAEEAKPKMPAWFDEKKVLWPLIDALPAASGVLRGDLIATLEKITRKDFGDNEAAWAAHARGEDVTEGILAKRVYPPYFFGIPVYGRRVVIVFDASVLTENVHPFAKRERLQELCHVPGGRDVPWFKLQSIKQFSSAWVKRFIDDAPTKRTYFELIFSGAKPAPVFGRLQGISASSKTKATEELDKLKAENDNDILAAMTLALDVSGAKDSAAWNKGPDEVCCVYSSVPWRAAETDPEVVGATVGLKARRRQVKIHAVGVHEYSYNMMKLFAEQSGGTYVALTH